MTCLVPSGVEDGHKMLMHLGIQASQQPLVDPTVGWTKVTALDQIQTGGDDLRANVYQRIASSEPASYEVSTSHLASGRQMQVAITVWSGVHDDVFDVTPISAHSIGVQDTVNPSCPAITSLTDDAVMVCFGVFGYTLLTGVGPQSGYEIQGEEHVQAVSAMLSTKTLGAAGLETPGPWTHTSGGFPESVINSLLLKKA